MNTRLSGFPVMILEIFWRELKHILKKKEKKKKSEERERDWQTGRQEDKQRRVATMQLY